MGHLRRRTGQRTADDEREARFLGIPGAGPWLPSWLIAYLAVVIPAAFLFKKLLRIH